MRRGTTPTITLTVDADVTGHAVEVTLRRPFMEPLTLTNDPDDNRLAMALDDGKTAIEFTLTQDETLAMHGPVEVQVRAVKNGVAIATDIGTLDVGRILREGVIHE